MTAWLAGGALLACGAAAWAQNAEISPTRPTSGSPSVDIMGTERYSVDPQTPTGDDTCLGVEFDGTYFWVTGAGNSGGTVPNQLYQLTKSGTLVNTYAQGTTDQWGWRDLAWDGQYLYASNSPDVAIIDPVSGTQIGLIDVKAGGPNPCRALAYDSTTDTFWTASWNSPIVNFDRSGTILSSTPHTLTGIYGMAHLTSAANGPKLWIWSQDPGVLASEWDTKTHMMTGRTFSGTNPATDLAGGACMYQDLVEGVWVMGAIHQGSPDMLRVYEIDPADLPGSWMNYPMGGGCAGTLGVPGLVVDQNPPPAPPGGPYVGWPMHIEMTSSSPAVEGGVMIWGLDMINVPLGGSGCSLYTTPLIVLPMGFAPGSTTMTLQIPMTPGLVGLMLHTQIIQTDPGGGTLPPKIAASPGMMITFGAPPY